MVMVMVTVTTSEPVFNDGNDKAVEAKQKQNYLTAWTVTKMFDRDTNAKHIPAVERLRRV